MLVILDAIWMFCYYRNMSVEGGNDVCEKMVEQDVMTPIITLLQQVGRCFCRNNIS